MNMPSMEKLHTRAMAMLKPQLMPSCGFIPEQSTQILAQLCSICETDNFVNELFTNINLLDRLGFNYYKA